MQGLVEQVATILTGEGIKLFVRRCLPVSSGERALVVFIHGFVEHSGRYVKFFDSLCARGVGVVAFDLRGHGRSEGPRAWIPSLADCLEDLSRVWAWAGQITRGVPLFLMGHSLGGLLAAQWVVDNPGAVHGLVLLAPAIKIGAVPAWIAWVAPVLAHVVPWAKVMRVGVRRLSRDPTVRQNFQTDPLVYHGWIPARSGSEIFRAAASFRRRASQVAVPLLILHGTGDRICSHEGSQELFDLARSRDKTLRLYPDLYHDLLHEPEAERVQEDIISWLETRIPS